MTAPASDKLARPIAELENNADQALTDAWEAKRAGHYAEAAHASRTWQGIRREINTLKTQARQPYTVHIAPRPAPDLPHRAIVCIRYDGEPLAWAAFAGPDDATAHLNPDDTDPGSISAAAGHYLTHYA